MFHGAHDFQTIEQVGRAGDDLAGRPASGGERQAVGGTHVALGQEGGEQAAVVRRTARVGLENQAGGPGVERQGAHAATERRDRAGGVQRAQANE